MIVDVKAAAERLSRGEVVAYPTETVYGLGADASSEDALERLFALKGRDPGQGLSVLVSDVDQLRALVPKLPERASTLAKRFWPGPLTLVIPLDDPRFSSVSTDAGVGFRCSSHPTAAALARAATVPVVSTSCNRSGEDPCLEREEVERVFGETLAIVGGEPAGGLPPSTVVALQPDGELKLLRESALPFAELLQEIET